MGILPMPLFSARDFSRRIPAPNVIAKIHPLFCTPAVFSGRTRSPLCVSAEMSLPV
jgi:hypothetical protein